MPDYARAFLLEFAGVQPRFPSPRNPESTTGINFGVDPANLAESTLANFSKKAGEDLCQVGTGIGGSMGFYLLGESGALYWAWDSVSRIGDDFAEGLLRMMTVERPV
jgi:hypothetical protein